MRRGRYCTSWLGFTDSVYPCMPFTCYVMVRVGVRVRNKERKRDVLMRRTHASIDAASKTDPSSEKKEDEKHDKNLKQLKSV